MSDNMTALLTILSVIVGVCGLITVLQYILIIVGLVQDLFYTRKEFYAAWIPWVVTGPIGMVIDMYRNFKNLK